MSCLTGEGEEDEEAASTSIFADFCESDGFYDRHRNECALYRVTDVAETGVALQEGDTEFSILCSLFVREYGWRLFSIGFIRLDAQS